jgi:hypothetical protein
LFATDILEFAGSGTYVHHPVVSPELKLPLFSRFAWTGKAANTAALQMIERVVFIGG